MDSDLVIVVYMGGTCGDLVSALLDPRGVELDSTLKKISMPPERQRLKKPHLFSDAGAKNQYLQDIARVYHSVPSHDIEYHSDRDHDFVGITVQDPRTAMWAAQRFRDAHRPQVWQSVAKACGINDIEQYAQLLLDYSVLVQKHTDKIMRLEDIRSGLAVAKLAGLTGRTINQDAVQCYIDWQRLQNSNPVS